MTDADDNELSVVAGNAVGGSCPQKMGRKGLICGRLLHKSGESIGQAPVCLMHSNDPSKCAVAELLEAFWQEFKNTLEVAGEEEAHFEGFRFPKLDLCRWHFRAKCRFDEAIFMQEAWFVDSVFMRDASFDGANFEQKVYFSGVKFMEQANFTSTIFMQEANFDYTIFTQLAMFTVASFRQYASFRRAVAEFVLFSSVSAQEADFTAATFSQNATFTGTNFALGANFNWTVFKFDVNFNAVTFAGDALFRETRFFGITTWETSRFLEGATFRQTKFDPQVEGTPSAIFALASFSSPKRIVFDDVDLSRALFHDCDVSEVWFTPSVRWARRRGHGTAVYDELVPLEHATIPFSYAGGLCRDGERDYRAIAQLYQQLKKNYDSRFDYWTANEFHFGEMEMKRLAPPSDGLFQLPPRIHPWISLTVWYRYASNYGNSYRKPMLWILAVLVLFALLFPLPGAGLRQSGGDDTQTYISVWQSGAPLKKSFQWDVGLFGKSLLVAVDTATFQRNPEYTPAYPWGRVLAVTETLLTSTLFGLFLLAIRRQFRR